MFIHDINLYNHFRRLLVIPQKEYAQPLSIWRESGHSQGTVLRLLLFIQLILLYL